MLRQQGLCPAFYAPKERVRGLEALGAFIASMARREEERAPLPEAGGRQS
jgi:hypothetical protein